VKKINKSLINLIRNYLANVQDILIVTHFNPDGDAIGSALAFYHYLYSSGYQASILVPNDYPDFLYWLPGNEKIIIDDKNHELALDEISKAELIIFLDFNVLDRTQQLEEVFKNTPTPKVLVDHHPNPQDFADIIISTTQVSSTSELLYELLIKLGGEEAISKTVAACLYTGIMTDTGSFSYNSSLPDTYYVVSKLIERGIDKDKIYWKVYDKYSPDRMRLLGYCLYQKLQVFTEFCAAYISISLDELQQFNYRSGDSEGFVNYPLSIKGVMFSVIFIERVDHIKISFRSKGDFPANTFAANHFNGGGHKNAAGGYSDLSLDETLEKFENLLPEYKKQLLENHIHNVE